MCTPIAALATATVVSGVFSAQQQLRQGRFQQGVAEYNARVAENEAEQVRRVGAERENVQRQRTAELISRQRAQLGASGVDVGSGSALQLQEDAQVLGEVDALRIRRNFEDRATGLETQASLTRQQGEAARSASRSATFGTLLGTAARVGVSGVADKWFTPKSAARQIRPQFIGEA